MSIQAASKTVCEAIEADKLGKYEEAYRLYESALETFFIVLGHETNPKTIQLIRARMEGYLSRAERLKKELYAGPVTAKDRNTTTPPEESNTKLRTALQSSILVEKPNVNWSDVAGLEQAKEMLKETVILPQRFPELFNSERRPWAGILLYGPPGTGKSFLAKAVATEAKSTFFSVSSSDLVSKWLGESQRLIRELFQMAREQSPSIIFIDEVDSLASNRSDGEDASQLQIKTEFLTQMDGVRNGSGQRVLVLGATNTPWSLDPAMRRRFEKRIYIPLPEEAARERMFRLSVGQMKHDLTDVDFRELARDSMGFSGADISIVVRSALMEPLKLAQHAEYFHVDKDGMCFPLAVGIANTCDQCPTEPKVACLVCSRSRMSLYDVDPNKLRVPDVTVSDFKRALHQTNPSVSPNELVRFDSWTKEFGQVG